MTGIVWHMCYKFPVVLSIFAGKSMHVAMTISLCSPIVTALHYAYKYLASFPGFFRVSKA